MRVLNLWHVAPAVIHPIKPHPQSCATSTLQSAADVRAQGGSPQLLIKLEQSGKLQRVSRGLYSLPNSEATQPQTLIELCRRAPKAVVCLLSAQQFHGIGTQLPFEVWIALPEATQKPALDYPTLSISRLRGDAYTEGIEITVEQGSTIRDYSVAKTVTDCFKFCHKVGLDVALEALKKAWQQRTLNMDDVMCFARINRVANVMQPDLEVVVV
jgi:predicted transcriptional regulator of viral defense system